ncbi:MAG: glycosyltransferase family 39 protein [Cyanobacteriota bacterium]|nr:glycosyltransferase family 39 protein [Cyanobacteriota bacterium]
MQWWTNFEKYPRRCLYFSMVWLIFINGLAFLWHLGSTGLVDETEPLFAEAARQMLETGDWITPYFNGETRFDKPPLIYWLMAIAYRLIGTNEWAVRLPSAMAAIAIVVFGFFTLLRFGFPHPKAASSPHPIPFSRKTATSNRRGDTGDGGRGEISVAQFNESRIKNLQISKSLWLSAWIGSTLMALNLQTLIWARTGVSDMLLSGCMGCALFCFFWGYATSEKQPQPRNILPNGWYLAFYILVALAVLTKGPVGAVIPGLTILGFLIYIGKFWEVVREMKVVFGGILFLILTLPWYILVTLRNGQAYIDSFFGYHNIERFTQVVNGHGAPWYFYFLVVLVGFLPWSFYLPIAIARLQFWRRSRWQNQPRTAHFSIFALSWFVAIFAFFTAAVTKLPSYTLPLIPAAAILVALFWSQELSLEGRGQRAEGRRNFEAEGVLEQEATGKAEGNRLVDNAKIPWGFVATGIANAILLLALAVVSFISPRLIGYDAAAPNLGELFGQTNLPIRSTIIWGIAGCAIAFLLWKHALRRWILAVNLISFIAFVIFALTPANFFIDRVRQLPLRQLAAISVQVQRPGEELMMSGFKKPTLVFYTQRPVRFFYGKEDTLAFVQQSLGDPNASPTVLLLSQSTAFANSFNLQPDQYETLGQRGSYQLIRVSRQTLLDAAQTRVGTFN